MLDITKLISHGQKYNKKLRVWNIYLIKKNKNNIIYKSS